MSGHSKWAQIKHKKAKTDAQKSKIYSKYAKLISVEAKRCKGDKNAPSLRAVVERAKSENVPNDVIDRAISKAATSADMERITYEAYGPGGCAMIIEALTDNRNKAAQEVKHILAENGFALAGQGAASWAFKKAGIAWEAETKVDLSDEDLAKLEKLVEDLENNDEVQEIYTNAE